MDNDNTSDIQLLNILINSKKEIRDFTTHSNEEMFLPNLRRFAKHLFGYFHSYNSCPSLTTLIEFATSGTNNNLEDYLIDTWKEIDDQYTDPREYSFILEKLRDRRKVDLLKSIQVKIDDGISDSSDVEVNSVVRDTTKIFNELRSVGEKRIYSESTLRDTVDNYVQRFKAKQENPELSRGVMTGFSVFDYYTNGIRGSELMIVAADTGGGKSVYLINLGVNVYLGSNKVPNTFKELNDIIQNNKWKPADDVLFISLEMPKDEIEDRIVSNMAMIDSLDLMKGRLVGDDEAKRLAIALKFWKNYPGNFKIVDVPRGCSVNQIQAIYDDVCLEFKPKIVIIDYLGLMTDSGDSEADWEKLKNVAEQLHEFARINDVAVVTGVQVKCSKPGEGGIGLHRIGRSSMIMHNANIALQIENRENEEMRTDAIIHCIKFRRGPKFVMNNLRKEFMYTRFADLGLPSGGPDKEKGKMGEDLSGLMNAMLDSDMDVNEHEE